MIRVLQIISDTNIGGGGHSLLNYLRFRDRERVEVLVALPRRSALKAPIVRVGTPNTYIPVGMVEWQIVPDKMDVIRAVKKTLGRELLEEEKGQVEVDGVAELRKSRPANDVD